MNNVSIVIPNFNGLELLKNNLPQVVKAAANPINKIGEIIIVDDASTDDSVDFLKKDYPTIRVFKFTKNRGFSSGVNMGVRMAKGNFVVLLNTDVFPEIDFLAHVFDHFADPKVFAVSFHERGYGWAKGLMKDGFIVHDPGSESTGSHISFWASGGSAMFRRKYWVELGGMDEKLLSPFYWEDIDLSYRAQKRGYIVLWEPRALVVHQHESTISVLPQKYVERIRQRNHLLFTWKNLTSKNLFKKHISGLLRRVVKHPGYLLIVLMTLPRLSLAIKKHKKEIKESKISDEAIFTKFSND
jgi:GT2 family glycosyltransferase